MKRKDYKIAFPAILVVVLLVFLFTIFFANVNLSFSDSSKNKSLVIDKIPAVERTSAEEEYWDYIVMVMWENAKDRDAFAKKIITAEQMKFHSEITKANLDKQKKFIRSFEEFYSIISDEDKNSIDKILRTRICAE
jgi:hypothetical protein